MSAEKKLSKTMRIDLIPEVPTEPIGAKKKRIVVHQGEGEEMGPSRERFEAKRPQDSKYDELLQSVYDAALITSLEGDIVDANVRAITFFQYERGEFLGLTVFDIISGSDESLMETLWENLEDERFTLIQAYCLRKDGTFFPAEIAVNKLRLEEVHFCFFVRDITLRKQAEQMLMTEHAAIQNAANGIAMADVEGHLEYVNPAVVDMWGFKSADDFMSRHVTELFRDKDAVQRMIEGAMGKQGIWMGEMQGRRVDGQVLDLQVSAVSNRSSEGDVLGVVFSFLDIGDRKRAEEATREMERHKVMLESLGAACHHLGQPATVLLGNLGIIHKRLDTDDGDMKKLVQSSMQAAESLGEILHKLNAVNEYKTTQYLNRPEGEEDDSNRILEI